MAEAYHLIQQKKQKPTEIYLEVGFETFLIFITSFKQKFGVTPASINNLHKLNTMNTEQQLQQAADRLAIRELVDQYAFWR